MDLSELAEEVEAAKNGLPDRVLENVIIALDGAETGEPVTIDALMSTDAILHLTDLIVPGWAIQLKGRAIEPNGHWMCSLRRSETKDNDEFIGQGRAPILSNAILAATLRTLEFQMRSKQIAG
ncbi:MAG: hypothetical protein HKN02_00825 [Rhodobacteraceae bacterium]|nr:hypothetical protein [Paracoccaceae bacterium]